ncbi:putative meiosis specific protein Spo22/ZIP4/TEX11 [Helianthus annuus]|nr:putative meiosis specific protein Spo22/ZIP4/TEX11 [Helianthus annuus]KAJ0835183.1 putative meiosis specific protein Spo22/ZIP4/TEX11 [Helianthus annuus]
MRIAEISSPEVRQTQPPDTITDLLSKLETLTAETERHSPESPLPDSITTNLRHVLSQLTPLSPFQNSIKLQIWKLSYRLWNACIDLSNFVRTSSCKVPEEHAKLRQVAADILFIAVDVTGVPSPYFKCASFFYKTGTIWHELCMYDFASNCFEKATDLTSKVDIMNVSDREERRLLLDLHIARSKTAWEVSDRNLAINLLNRSKRVLFGVADSYMALANQYMCFGKLVLSKSEACSANDAVKLMNEALELCEKGLRSVKKVDETLGLKELRLKTLRFMAASHLQRDEFDSVLKCVRVLRDGEKGEDHPSSSVLAMKAWLGLGRHGEAEKELKSMVGNKGIPEGVWVSAMESYLQAVGCSGVETAMGVFLGLLGRCHISAAAAFRVVQRVVADCLNGEGPRARAKVVAEFVSNDKVVALFSGEVAAKERSGMHALLWNCAADHFRSKDYEVSAELFEKSLLYVPHDIENRSLRAKGFRVLCLCHLALSHLDRAQEYIDEAAKLEPNIACVFLKFKICLQNNDHNGAITQVQAMPACIDFTPDFLSLSAHEAIACRALSVAVDSLSRLLTFFSMGKPMPTTEVIVFRTLITILIQQPQNEKEVLKYMKQAHSRFSDLGPERFFGSGEVGRRERNWFALNLWNIGLKSGQENNYDLCGELFRTCAEYYGVSIDGQMEGNNPMVCKSLILAVSAMLAGEKLSMNPLSDNEVKQAIDLLERAEKILMSGSMKTSIDDDQTTTIEPHFYFIYTLSAYDLYTRTNDTESKQLLLIKNYANSKHCNTNHLFQIGRNASEGPRPNTEVATFCFNTCISLLLSSASPDYQTVALILRKLITITGAHKCNAAADDDGNGNGNGNDDDGVYGMYKKAYRIMVGLKAGEYPVEEGKWLAITAWNRAALPVRLGQTVEAKKWMDMGLELAGRVPGMDTYKSCMEDFVSGVEKKVQSQGHLIVGS